MSTMGYKLLGYLVWHGGKWYLRRNYSRRLSAARTRLAIGGVLALVLGGAVAVIARRG